MAASRRRTNEEGRIMAMSVKDALKEALKELPDDAPREQTMQYIDAAIAKAEAVEGAESEAPAAEPVEEVAASIDTPPGAEPVALEDDTGAMADGAVSMVAEAAGTDAAAVIAAMQEDPAAFAALVTGTPGDAPSEEVFSDVKAAAASRVGALSRQLATRDAEVKALTARLDALDAESRERAVDDAISEGLFTDDQRERLVRLARNAPGEWDYWLSAAKVAPAVPTGRVVQASKAKSAGLEGLDSARGQLFERVLSAAIKDPEKRQQIIREKLAATDRD
jgi:hypothetical protein